MAETNDAGRASTQPTPVKVSRRNFLKASLLLTTGAGIAAAGCAPTAETQALPTPVAEGLNNKYLNVPPAPTAIPQPDTYSYFNFDQITTLDAMVSRILPGTADDPGAHEAGVVTFMDHMLAQSQDWPEPTYTAGPFAKTYEGDTPPPDEPNVVWVKKDQLERYGFQAKQSIREIYQQGIEGLNKYAQAKHQKSFAELSAADRDAMLKDMANGKIEAKDFAGENAVNPKTFFMRIQNDTIDGYFGDPVYGGNRDGVGWKLIGYPGAHRAYTPEDMHNENFQVDPQPLPKLPPFHTGQPTNAGVILPAANAYNVTHTAHPNALEQFLNYCRLLK